MKTKLFYISATFFILLFHMPLFAESIKIGTWNIERLGDPGRGFSGIGSGNLPLRTDDQLKAIAVLLRDTLKIDLIALQEVAISESKGNFNISTSLKKITQSLGRNWRYHVGNPGEKNKDSKGEKTDNIQCAFVWNTQRVKHLKIFDFSFPNEIVGEKRLFDRKPLIGYFVAIENGKRRNDFLLVNVHLTSGQDNDENHLAAMVILEQNIDDALKKNGIKESDRIILGDFNDNPFAKEGDRLKYSDFLYKYLRWKGYSNLVNENTGTTRMNKYLSSIIDHILVNNSAKRHIPDTVAVRYFPSNNKNVLAQWRKTYSDHFPLTFQIKIGRDDAN